MGRLKVELILNQLVEEASSGCDAEARHLPSVSLPASRAMLRPAPGRRHPSPTRRAGHQRTPTQAAPLRTVRRADQIPNRALVPAEAGQHAAGGTRLSVIR